MILYATFFLTTLVGRIVLDLYYPDDVPLLVLIAWPVALFVLLLVLPGAVMALRHPVPYADLTSQTLRVGSRVPPFAAFTTARRLPTSGRIQRVAIEVAAPQQTVVLELRDGLGRITTGPTQDAIVRFLEGSSITMPTSRHDPTGRFAHVNFPQHLTREQAIDLARHPLTIPDVAAGHHGPTSS